MTKILVINDQNFGEVQVTEMRVTTS